MIEKNKRVIDVGTADKEQYCMVCCEKKKVNELRLGNKSGWNVITLCEECFGELKNKIKNF